MVDYWVVVEVPISCENPQIQGWRRDVLTISVPVEASLSGGVDLERVLLESSGALLDLDPDQLSLVDFEITNEIGRAHV